MRLRQPRCIYSVCEPLTKNKENRGRSRVIKECIIKYIKNTDHQIWTKLQISEIRIAILFIFVSGIVLLECIMAISIFFMFYVHPEYLHLMFHLWKNRVVDLH